MAAALEPTRKRDALLNSPALTLLAESPGPTCLWLSKSYAPSCCQARVPCPTHSDARLLQRIVAATSTTTMLYALQLSRDLNDPDGALESPGPTLKTVLAMLLLDRAA